MAKLFKCKNPKCPSKGKPQEIILVISECTQRFSIPDDNWTDTDIGDTLYGQCKECMARIPAKTVLNIMENAGS